MTEKELLENFTAGDPLALEELVSTYFPVLCRFAEKFLSDSSLAKDVVQETFIRFWNARKPFDSLHALKAYLFISTKNGCLNLNRGRLRQENRHLEAYARSSEPESFEPYLTEMVRAENLALVYQVVRALPNSMQEIFYLSYEEGMTVKEISIHLDMKLQTVKNHKYKTLLILRSKFGKNRGGLLVLLSFLLK